MATETASRKGPREKRDYWRARIREWSKSGLTQAEFCRRRSLSIYAFRWWKHRLQGSGSRSSGGRRRCAGRFGKTPFLPVRIVPEKAVPPPSSVPPIEILLPQGRVVRVRDGFDARLLKEVISVLEA